MALGTNLPLFPALVFTYLEPLSLLLGFREAFLNAPSFINDQIPASASPFTPSTPSPNAYVLSFSIGNVYLLLAAYNVLFTVVNRNPRVTKFFLAVTAAADLNHVYATYRVVGPEVMWNFNEYTSLMWGNVGMSLVLHVVRVGTVMGLFGRVGK